MPLLRSHSAVACRPCVSSEPLLRYGSDSHVPNARACGASNPFPCLLTSPVAFLCVIVGLKTHTFALRSRSFKSVRTASFEPPRLPFLAGYERPRHLSFISPYPVVIVAAPSISLLTPPVDSEPQNFPSSFSTGSNFCIKDGAANLQGQIWLVCPSSTSAPPDTCFPRLTGPCWP